MQEVFGFFHFMWKNHIKWSFECKQKQNINQKRMYTDTNA